MADQTKKCRECLADIPKKARKCSHCGSKQPENAVAWLVIILVITGVIIFAVYEPSNTSYTPSVNTPTQTTRTLETASNKAFVPTHYIDPTEFRNGGVQQVNVWRSYEDRTKVGELLGTHEVELVDRDEENNYCHVENKKVNGWILCDWLVEIDK